MPAAADFAPLLDQALARVEHVPGSGVVLEGSIAEGFGNARSDVDFLLIEPAADRPTMPSVLFLDGRRVEVRSRSVAQVERQFAAVLAAERSDRTVAALGDDLLNRCQRLLFSVPMREPGVLEGAAGALTRERFAAIVGRWWRHQARQSLRLAVALTALGQHEEAAAWAETGLLQAAKSWAAAAGETYVEPKWTALQLARIPDGAQIAARYDALAQRPADPSPAIQQAYVAAARSLAGELGTDGIEDDPGRVVLERVPHVTTWPTGEGLHVIRGHDDAFTLGPAAARAWRQVVFGRTLPDTLERAARAAGGDADAGALLATFLRYGFVRLAWEGRPGRGTIRPYVPLLGPLAPATPAPRREAPVIALRGDRSLAPDAVALLPLPAPRLAEAAATIEWANVLVENAREDLLGALADEQWQVATHSAHRMLLVACRVVLAAQGMVPLPAHADLLRVLREAGIPGTEPLIAEAATLELHAIRDAEDGDRALHALDRFAAQARALARADAFPSSFESPEDWRRTIEFSYDWLRLCAYLDSGIPIDEARDLLATGGQQPHITAGGDA